MQTQKPQPKDYGYQEGGLEQERGWMIEEGEQEYQKALKKWNVDQIKKVIEKYFGFDLKVKYYHPSDSINKDNYIRYEYLRNDVVLSVGSSDGEVQIGLFSDASKLNQIIDLIIY